MIKKLFFVAALLATTGYAVNLNTSVLDEDTPEKYTYQAVKEKFNGVVASGTGRPCNLEKKQFNKFRELVGMKKLDDKTEPTIDVEWAKWNPKGKLITLHDVHTRMQKLGKIEPPKFKNGP